MHSKPRANEIGLLTVLRGWWWALVLGGAVAGATGYAVASTLPKTYEATVKTLVGPINTDLALVPSGILGRTYAQLATSRPVLQAAIDATHARVSATDLVRSVTANSNDVTRLVTITVSDRHPEVAAHLANALAGRLSTIAKQVPPQFNTTIRAFEGQPEVTALRPAAARAVDQAARRTFSSSPAGQLQTVDPAQPPTSATSPNVPLLGLLATVGGVVIAGLLALLRVAQGPRSLDEATLAELADPPFVGAVDVTRTSDPARALAVERDPLGAAAAEYRVLAARLRLLDDDRRISSLLVVDAADGIAAGVVAANLAGVLAEAGRSVMLVDATTGEDGMTSLLGLNGKPGYAEVLSDPPTTLFRERLDELCGARAHGLRVLPRGSAQRSEVTPLDRLRRSLLPMTSTADLVVICGPSLLGSAGALTWAQACDAVLLVADSRRVSRDQYSLAVADLACVEAEVIGTVLARSGRPWRIPAVWDSAHHA